ncbi:MAG: Mur ligase family protein, partial [Atopococcus tabaci]|nr:Mur ligase family protein [Atopococcus tabaci]
MTYSLSITQIQDVLVEHGLIREITHNGELLYRIKDPAILEKKITELSYFSKTAHENTLFICKGAAFKEEYLSDALNHGAQFFVAEQLYQVSSGIGFIVHDVRKAMAILAKTFYQAPDEKLKIIGITATKGKTTTTYYTKDILQANFPGQVGFISGEEMCLDGINYLSSNLSTPESLELYSYLAQAIENGLNCMVLEISSQAYKMDRVYGLDLDVGIFMNITEDHVSPEEHQSMEEYFYC